MTANPQPQMSNSVCTLNCNLNIVTINDSELTILDIVNANKSSNKRFTFKRNKAAADAPYNPSGTWDHTYEVIPCNAGLYVVIAYAGNTPHIYIRYVYNGSWTKNWIKFVGTEIK